MSLNKIDLANKLYIEIRNRLDSIIKANPDLPYVNKEGENIFRLPISQGEKQSLFKEFMEDKCIINMVFFFKLLEDVKVGINGIITETKNIEYFAKHPPEHYSTGKVISFVEAFKGYIQICEVEEDGKVIPNLFNFNITRVFLKNNLYDTYLNVIFDVNCNCKP